MSCHAVYRINQIETDHYRFLSKTGGYHWLSTQASLVVCPKNQKPQCIVCVHYIIRFVNTFVVPRCTLFSLQFQKVLDVTIARSNLVLVTFYFDSLSAVCASQIAGVVLLFLTELSAIILQNPCYSVTSRVWENRLSQIARCLQVAGGAINCCPSNSPADADAFLYSLQQLDPSGDCLFFRAIQTRCVGCAV